MAYLFTSLEPMRRRLIHDYLKLLLLIDIHKKVLKYTVFLNELANYVESSNNIVH